ncbi:hypothetical protein ACFPA8_21055 [Streptomyces ovatisporus]|uniref:Secreted protein n=1 Tax=Streptomyces ovatisporus TaxID=1128682 RepID=A0ABV9AAW9_9ACTN
MRTIRAVLMTAAVTLAASTFFAGTAQAAPERVTGANCDSQYRAHKDDGYFRAYDAVDCREELGAAQGDDPNWADGSGAFRGSDNDKATSVLNTGTYSGGINNVLLYQGAQGGSNGVGCLSHGELYVDDLRDNTFTGGANANNKISRHSWSSSCTNPWT